MTLKNIFISCFFSLAFVLPSKSQSLDDHTWEERVILLFTPDFQNEAFQKQIKILEKHHQGLQDRKLIIYQVSPKKVKKDNEIIEEKNWIASTYHRFNISNNTFTFILIGLDGGEKLRRTKPIELPKLFGKIDQMPMRRAEMRKGKKN